MYLDPVKRLPVMRRENTAVLAPPEAPPACSFAHTGAAACNYFLSSLELLESSLSWRCWLGLRMGLGGDRAGGRWDPTPVGPGLGLGCPPDSLGKPTAWVPVRRAGGQDGGQFDTEYFGVPRSGITCTPCPPALGEDPGVEMPGRPARAGRDSLSGELPVSSVTLGTLPETPPLALKRQEGHTGPPRAGKLRAEVVSSVAAGQVALGLAVPWVAQALLPGNPPGCLSCPVLPKTHFRGNFLPRPLQPPRLGAVLCGPCPLPRPLGAPLSSSRAPEAGCLQGRPPVLRGPVPGLCFHREGAPGPPAPCPVGGGAHVWVVGTGLGALPTPQAFCSRGLMGGHSAARWGAGGWRESWHLPARW